MISKEDIEKVLENLQNAGMTRDEIGAAIGYKDENGINAAKARLAKDPSKFYNALCLLYENWILKNVIKDGGQKVGKSDKSGAGGVSSGQLDQSLITELEDLLKDHKAVGGRIEALLKKVSQEAPLEPDIDLTTFDRIEKSKRYTKGETGKKNK